MARAENKKRSNAFCLFRLFTAKRRISVRDNDTHRYLCSSVPGTERTAESSSVGRVANQRPTCAHVTQQRQAQQRRHVTSPAMVKLHVVSDVSMFPLTAVAAARCVIILCRNQRRR